MKTLHIPVGLVVCCLLSSCAHDQLKSTSNAASKPEVAAITNQTATFTVTAGGTVPLSYQWQFNGGTNTVGAILLTNVNGSTGVIVK
jgi:hypothetical protein